MKTKFTTSLILLFFLSFAFGQTIEDTESVTIPDVSQARDTIQPFDDLPSSTTVITAQEIEERGYDNMDELLASVQGISITHDRTFTQIGIRGMSPTAQNNQRVQVLLDGVALNNPISGLAPSGIDLRGIAMEDIEKVIISRSASPVENGNNAMLGLIKIETKNPRKGLRLNFDTGSYGELDGGFALGHSFGETTIGLSGRLADITGPEVYIPGDVSIEKEGANYRGLRLRINRSKFFINGFFNDWEEQVNGSEAAPALLFSDFDPAVDPFGGFRAYRSRRDTVTNLKGRQLYFDFGFSTPVKTNQFVEARVFVNFERQQQEQFFTDDVFEYEVDSLTMMVSDSFPWSTLDFFETPEQEALWIGIDYKHQYNLDKHRLQFGTNLLALPVRKFEKELTPTFYEFIQDNESTTTDFPEEVIQFLNFFNDSLYLEEGFFSYWSTSFFVRDRYQISPAFAIEGGLRADINSQTNPVLAPEFGLLIRPFGQKTQIRLGYMQGYRLPSILETNVSPLGSTDPPVRAFTPEKAHNFELGWQQQIGQGLVLNNTLYHQQLQDMVWNEFSIPPSQVDSIIALTGLEGGLAVQFKKGIRSYLNYNFQFDRRQVFNLPSPSCKFGLTLPFLRHFTLFAEGQYEGDRLTLTGARTLPYFLFNSNLLIKPKIAENNPSGQWLNNISLAFRAYNILDQFYQHPTEVERVSNGQISQNGRTWQAQLTLQF